MRIEAGRIYDLRYGIYYGCSEIIPCTNKVKVVSYLVSERREDEYVVIRSVERAGLHDDREITISAYDFLRAIGHTEAFADEFSRNGCEEDRVA